MDRPALLAVPVAVVSALVVPLRSLVAFQSLQDFFGLTTLSLLARPLWMTLAIVGFAAVGYAYGTTARSKPTGVLAVAALAGFVGSAVGYLLVRFGADTVAQRGSLLVEMGILGGYAMLDAALFGLLVVGGYALTFETGRSE
jgi:cellobiose-specific phosphotransferase system component IIC